MVRSPYPRLSLRLLAVFAIALATAKGFDPAHAATPKRAVLQGEFREWMSRDVAAVGGPDMVIASREDPRRFTYGLLSNERREAMPVIVGVSAGPINGDAVRALAIRARGGAASKDVCLTVLTRDGVYRASNRYVLPTDMSTGETILLPYEKSRRLSFLRQYGDAEIAVMAVNGQCDFIKREEAYLVYRYGTSERRQVLLYINSSGATDVHAGFVGQEKVQCRSVRERRTQFDYTCSLDWPAGANQARAELAVISEHYGRTAQPAFLFIEYADAP